MIRKYLCLLGLIFMVSGCATYATGRLFTKAPFPLDNKSVLYVYHAKSFLVYSPMLKINGKPFVRLDRLGYSYAYLSPGIYTLSFEYGGFEGNFITEIQIKEGEEVFKEYTASGYEKNLYDVPKEDALNKLKEYRYVEPLNSDFE